MTASYLGWPFYLFIFLITLSLGSFLNSWMWRAWENIKVTTGRSICIYCRRQLNWYENIPLFSFIFLGGNCRTCHKKISWQYPLVEFATAAALTFIAWHRVENDVFFSDNLLYPRDVFFIAFLIIIFVFDALHKVILSRIVWTGAIIGFLFNYFALNISPLSMFYGALAAGGFFWVQYLVSKGKWIGGGDVRLGVMMGIWLGWPSVLIALFLSYIIGATYAIFALLFKKSSWKSQVPFGTFLAMGTVVAIYYGEDIVRWYLNFLK